MPLHFIGIAGYTVDFKGSPILLILLVLFAISWGVLAYWRTVPPVRWSLRLLLGSLRAAALLLLIFLIFEPSLSRRVEKHLKPLLAVLLDDTQSIQLTDAGGPRTEQLIRLLHDPVWQKLKERFEVEVYSAGDSLRPLPDLSVDSLRFATIGTNLAGAWEQAVRRAGENPYGAIILVTDGGDNTGKNPQQAAREASVPLFTIGLGDPTPLRDASIASVDRVELAYRGKETQIHARIKAQGLAGKMAIVELTDPQGQVLAKASLKLPPEGLETEVNLKYTPLHVGLLPLQLHLTSSDQESSQDNNLRTLPLEVRESQIRVLVVSGQPNFESQFFVQTSRSLPDLKVRSLTLRPDGSPYGSNSETLSQAVQQSDVLVLFSLLQQGNPFAVLERLKRVYLDHPVPVWFWMGAQFNPSALPGWNLDVPFKIIRVANPGPAVAVPVNYYTQLDPDAESAENPSWNDLPPLDLPDWSPQVDPGAEILINLKDAQSGANRGPALITWETQGKRMAASFGLNYWRWSFLTIGLQGNDELYRSLISRMVRWLAASPLSKTVRVTLDQNLYSVGQEIRFRAQVARLEGQKVTTAQVEIGVEGPDGSARVALEPDASGHYSGLFHPQSVGTHTFSGWALFDGDTLGTDSGRFLVEAYNIEKETLNQNRALLEAIAQESGGQYFPADSISLLAQAIPAPPRLVSVGWHRRFFLNWDLWGLVIGLLAVEWIIRKRKGML